LSTTESEHFKNNEGAKERLRQQQAPAPCPATAPHHHYWGEWFKHRLASLLVFGFIVFGTVRIVSTYSVFNHTVDELAHLACGMEWLDRGTYMIEGQHPPLARIMGALGPYLSGIGLQGVWDKQRDAGGMYAEGMAILRKGDQYQQTLVLSHLGILPFFWIGCLAVYFWARKYFGAPTGVVAVFLFTFIPTVLAHSSVTTTDMALTAFMGAVFVAMLFWCEDPSDKRSLIFGTMVALAILSKFSCLAFFPAATLATITAYLVAAQPGIRKLFASIKNLLLPAALALSVAILIIWAGYRFHYGQVFFAHIKLPAPELYSGIKSVWDHNQGGHATYLLGMHNDHGWWYFFPIALGIKTPLPLLLLLFFGAWESIRRWKEKAGAFLFPLCFSLAILGVGMAGHINVGVRHILPVYIGFSIIAAIGAVRLYELGRNVAWVKWFLWFCMGWMAYTSLAAHPDYLAYFNFLAGDAPETVPGLHGPEKILADSDVDWGQDMRRLAARLKEKGITRFSMIPISWDDYSKNDMPQMDWGNAYHPNPGWNAVSISFWLNMRMGIEHPWPDSPDAVPVEHVGKGILLYYFPEKTGETRNPPPARTR
jgi:hypothetical protein